MFSASIVHSGFWQSGGDAIVVLPRPAEGGNPFGSVCKESPATTSGRWAGSSGFQCIRGAAVSRAFRFGTCNESHSMQSRQSTVVTITFLNAAGLTSVGQGSVSTVGFPAFHFNQDFPKIQFPPKNVSCRGQRSKSRWKAYTSWSTPLSRSVQHRAPALPGASRTCGPHGPPACYMAHPFSARDLARIALRACARTLQNVPNQDSSPPVCLCPVASAANLIYKDA